MLCEKAFCIHTFTARFWRDHSGQHKEKHKEVSCSLSLQNSSLQPTSGKVWDHYSAAACEDAALPVRLYRQDPCWAVFVMLCKSSVFPVETETTTWHFKIYTLGTVVEKFCFWGSSHVDRGRTERYVYTKLTKLTWIYSKWLHVLVCSGMATLQIKNPTAMSLCLQEITAARPPPNLTGI